ncbi:MAG: epoxyqueuosine reductase QueH [Candidatus Dojkabacteria bacterium]
MKKGLSENLKVSSPLLVHTCCADCFLNSMKYLQEENLVDERTEIVSLFYNPNIHPRSEYYERLNALKKVIAGVKDLKIKLVIPDYRPTEYMEMVRDNLQKRCQSCWELRLRYVFQYARENGIKYLTSTLLTSHYQSKDIIMKIVNKINKEYSLEFIEVDDRCNCKNTGFYKQNYCGCCFSLIEKMESK